MNTRLRAGIGLPAVIIIIAVALAGSGVAVYLNKQAAKKSLEEQMMMMEKTDADIKMQMEKKPDDAMMKKDEGMMDKEEDGAMMQEGAMMKFSGSVLAGNQAKLLDFKAADYDLALKSNKVIVLYFYANWCPICKAEFPKMAAAFNELDTDAVVGFRVGYKDGTDDEDEQALAREFGVGYQHTKIILKNGKQALKTLEGWDKARYVSEINAHIN